MERFTENDKKITLIIILLVGLFVLNACGSRDMANPRNIDPQKSWQMQKDTMVYQKPETTNLDNGNSKNSGSNTSAQPTQNNGGAREILEPIFVNDKVTYKPSSGIFTPLELIANPKTKHVLFNTEVNIGGVKKVLTMEGDYTTDGVASIVHSKEQKNNKDIGVAAIRCLDETCGSLITDIVVKKINENGEESFEQTQFEIPVKKVDDNGAPVLAVPAIDPIDTSAPPLDLHLQKPELPLVPKSNLNLTPELPLAPKSLPNATSSSVKPVTTPAKQPEAVKPPIKKDIDEEENFSGEAAGQFNSALPEEMIQNLEPIVNFSKKPLAVAPVPKKPMTNLPPLSQRTYPSDAGINFQIFSADMGDQYPGRAAGCYTQKLCNDQGKSAYKSRLYAGTDVVAGRIGSKDASGIGFTSLDLSGTHVVFTSGLVKKHIEEVGKLYSEKYPNEKFRTTHLSKQGGGSIPRELSHQNGLEVDVLLPVTKAGHLDYQKILTLMNMFDSFGLVDRFFLDRDIAKNMCQYATTPELKKTIGKINHWDGHTDHFHVRDKCTIQHNPSCIPTIYSSQLPEIHC